MGNRRTTIGPETGDAELVARYQREGDPEVLDALISRYRRFARAKARGYFLIGGDSDDVEQEALIGLYKAVRDYRPEHQASFRAFAELCIKRQIITAIKTATRQKHQPLNQYQSISGARPGDEAGEASIDEILVSRTEADPCDAVVADERMRRMHDSLDRLLSGLEVEVLRLYVEGKSYQEISDQLGRHTKSIDNALQRIKRKLDGKLEDEPLAAAV
ncbi:MAG TPA: RNA polymerase sporulation sigma factor SigH [Acidimicrobiales bacterium]|nr:RNA polymerase sporulation sigma factor SigH [Acidimicrobiales bacterium]